MHRAAVTVGWVGAAHRFVVDGYGPPPAGPSRHGCPVRVGQPGADGTGQRIWVQAGKGSADGGLGRAGEVAGGVAAGHPARPGPAGAHQRPTRRSRRPTGAGQHRGGGQAQDGDQGVAAATGSSRIGDGGEAGEQLRGVGVGKLERVGLGEVGQGGWDRG